MSKDQFDEISGYCRMLGHYVPFHYCRTVQQDNPCAKILDCYFERFPIQDFLSSNYSESELSAINSTPPPKLHSILELVKKAQNRTS